MKNVYIVTGANGFLGNWIVRKLAAKGDGEVRALVLPGDTVPALADVDCVVYRGDVTKPETLEPLFQASAAERLIIIHCAAIVSIKTRYDRRICEVNINGTRNVAEKALEKNARLVYVSSVHAIPEKPDNSVITETETFDPAAVEGLYAKTKAAAARYVLGMVKERGLDACILHPSGIIGPNDFGSSHLTQMLIDFTTGRLRACVRGGYDFVDVRDVADGILHACEKGQPGACYILSNGYYQIRELLDMASEYLGTPKIRSVLPMWFAKWTAPLSELYYQLLRQPPLYTRYSLFTLTANARFSNEKAKRELGYRTRPMKETIADTLAWLEARGVRPHKAGRPAAAIV